jgi:small membrane protein
VGARTRHRAGGIGRGVDLIIYTWVAISLLVLLNLHLKLRAQMDLITVLARQMAIAGAARPLDISADAPSLQPEKVRPI